MYSSRYVSCSKVDNHSWEGTYDCSAISKYISPRILTQVVQYLERLRYSLAEHGRTVNISDDLDRSSRPAPKELGLTLTSALAAYEVDVCKLNAAVQRRARTLSTVCCNMNFKIKGSS
jgi:hypothetical protein